MRNSENDIRMRCLFKSRETAYSTRLIGGILYAYGNQTVAPYSGQFYIGGATVSVRLQCASIGPGSYVLKINSMVIWMRPEMWSWKRMWNTVSLSWVICMGQLFWTREMCGCCVSKRMRKVRIYAPAVCLLFVILLKCSLVWVGCVMTLLSWWSAWIWVLLFMIRMTPARKDIIIFLSLRMDWDCTLLSAILSRNRAWFASKGGKWLIYARIWMECSFFPPYYFVALYHQIFNFK